VKDDTQPEGGRWAAAKDLQVGDQLLAADGHWVTLTATTSELHPEGITVYNLTVDGDHTYFVTDASGDEAVWVHNADTPAPPPVTGDPAKPAPTPKPPEAQQTPPANPPLITHTQPNGTFSVSDGVPYMDPSGITHWVYSNGDLSPVVSWLSDDGVMHIGTNTDSGLDGLFDFPLPTLPSIHLPATRPTQPATQPATAPTAPPTTAPTTRPAAIPTTRPAPPAAHEAADAADLLTLGSPLSAVPRPIIKAKDYMVGGISWLCAEIGATLGEAALTVFNDPIYGRKDRNLWREMNEKHKEYFHKIGEEPWFFKTPPATQPVPLE
jgi:hypothetical protein